MTRPSVKQRRRKTEQSDREGGGKGGERGEERRKERVLVPCGLGAGGGGKEEDLIWMTSAPTGDVWASLRHFFLWGKWLFNPITSHV
ncbi:hypothetical protein E2C01_086741 [Portunus trituberculatus]|uniref:Uncharacterized protein n=1 Tax=Portunus trituberculatus TaxID=210409 RepID=A0A5B7JC92_PORTR|nr:hypothetical protein [Portunus trituberculatus]